MNTLRAQPQLLIKVVIKFKALYVHSKDDIIMQCFNSIFSKRDDTRTMTIDKEKHHELALQISGEIEDVVKKSLFFDY